MFAPFFSLFLLFDLLILAFGMDTSRHGHEEKIHHRIGYHPEKKTILYCSDNKYFSHFAFSVELAKHLKDDYNVHFVVLDHPAEKEENDDVEKYAKKVQEKEKMYEKVAKEILLIRVPIDENYVEKNFLSKVQKGFTDWKRNEIRSHNPDLWTLEEMNTVNMYQAVAVHNPPKIKRGPMEVGEKENILDWLRKQHYDLGMAEWGRLTAAFQIFHELGIEKKVATAAPVVNAAYYHFLQMPIPLDIPEFFSAQPKEEGQLFNLENNKKEYERILPLGEMLRQCMAFLVNQPFGLDFPWSKPPMIREIGGIVFHHMMDLYAAKVLGPERKYQEKMGKIQHKLLDPKEKCIVVFSMGTIVDFTGFTQNDLDTMLAAFKKHPECKFHVRFDTKNEKFNIKEKPENVKFVDFHGRIAQQEILAQRNIRAFIAQGGQNTFNEAVYAGVPTIVFPFFYDQPYNAALVEHLGIGIYVKPSEFAAKFPEALRKILKNEEYSKKAIEIAQKLHKKTHKPLDIFLDTIKKAIESKGSPKKFLSFNNVINFVWPKGMKEKMGK